MTDDTRRAVESHAGYRCPCRVCPVCGEEKDDDACHPADGLAYCADERHGIVHGEHVGHEWWVHIGPYMDGGCPTSEEEQAAWKAHDEAVHAGTASGTAIRRLSTKEREIGE